jgi:hypothetical protein
MNENAKAWIAALRSGEYEQGKKALHVLEGDGVGYCCLGVACDLAVKAGVPLTRETELSEVIHQEIEVFVTENGVRAVAYLPPPVRKWLGVRTDGGNYDAHPSTHGFTSLATKNDDGATFGEIADIIESEPKGLFGEGIDV